MNSGPKATSKDASLPNLLWDLTNNVTFGCWKGQSYTGILPCLLRGHRLWHLASKRPVMGLELLGGQGFPIDEMVTEKQVNGRDMKVPVAWFQFG